MAQTRKAQCSCGSLSVQTQGDPVYVAACHCIECKRRTGAAFGVSAWFKNEQVQSDGTSKSYVRTARENRAIRFEFCPNCGTSLFYQADIRPGLTAVVTGAFGDPDFPAPTRSIWETNRHEWVDFKCDVERFPEASSAPATE
jgi:hypothetical protein